MNLLNILSIGLKEIWANKFRSGLTMLGIILGVGSLAGLFPGFKAARLSPIQALRYE